MVNFSPCASVCKLCDYLVSSLRMGSLFNLTFQAASHCDDTWRANPVGQRVGLTRLDHQQDFVIPAMTMHRRAQSWLGTYIVCVCVCAFMCIHIVNVMNINHPRGQSL